MSDEHTEDECRDRNLDAIALIRSCLDIEAADHAEKVDAILSTLEPNQMFDVLYALSSLGAILLNSWHSSLAETGADEDELPSPDQLLDTMVQTLICS